MTRQASGDVVEKRRAVRSASPLGSIESCGLASFMSWPAQLVHLFASPTSQCLSFPLSPCLASMTMHRIRDIDAPDWITNLKKYEFFGQWTWTCPNCTPKSPRKDYAVACAKKIKRGVVWNIYIRCLHYFDYLFCTDYYVCLFLEIFGVRLEHLFMFIVQKN
jgi:hypothetical protein